MAKEINEFPILGELTDETIFHVKDGSIDYQLSKEVLFEAIEDLTIADASTSVKGVVQLSNSVSSTSEVLAATPLAVKTVNDAVTAKANSSVQVVAGDGLTGGGALTSNATLTLGTPTTLSTSTTNAVTPTSHSHAVTFPVTSVAGKTGPVSLSPVDMGASTIGSAFVTTPNPNAVRFPRVNADNTLSYLSAAAFLTAIGGSSGGGGGGSGTVTSVAMAVPTGLLVSGTPITESGIFTVTFDSGYSIPTTTKQTEWDTSYSQTRQWDGGATGLNAETGRTSLGATIVGSNFLTSANPSAITFPRVNADNTVTYLVASDFRDAIGVGTGSGTVTSVGISTPTGLTVSDSPVTSSGTISITFTSGYSIPLNSSQTNWDTAFTQTRQWDGGSTGLVAPTGRTSLGGTTVGQNFFTLANPSAVRFPRINADNTVSGLTDAQLIDQILYQSVNSHVSTFLQSVNTAAARTSLELGNAAQATLVTSSTDTTSGRVPTVGWMGLGGEAPIGITPGVGSFFVGGMDDLSGYPSGVNIKSGDGYNFQIYGNAGLDSDVRFRKQLAGVWRPSYIFYHTGNTSANVQTMLGAADNAAIVSNIGAAKRISTLAISTSTHNLENANQGIYHRFTFNGAKSVTVRPNSSYVIETDATFVFRNANTGNLTIVAGSGVTINPSAGGTLVLEPNMTVTLQKVGTDTYDLIGQTVPA